MGAGAILEPLVVVVLLVGGTWINRRRSYSKGFYHRCYSQDDRPALGSRDRSADALESGLTTPDANDCLIPRRSLSLSLLPGEERTWRTRELDVIFWRIQINSPNTAVFRNRLLSRLLLRLPFLVEVWYWALVYWVPLLRELYLASERKLILKQIYQIGRALTALTLQEHTVDVARQHARQVIALEQKLCIFLEVEIQHLFMENPALMTWTNWIYSFIHIPGTIAFLVWLYYYTITLDRPENVQCDSNADSVNCPPNYPAIYAARRRTMAVCNILAFVIFTWWPCMPPRLLSDPSVEGPVGDQSRSYGFVDTVHGATGAGSVWTQNRFCNQYAAMPSLHFGYSLMIGFTIMTIPLAPNYRYSLSLVLPGSAPAARSLCLPSGRRLLCVILGFLYPVLILCAIVATANHFILDAVAGGFVCCLGWLGNRLLLNLLPVEDCFLWLLRLHKPEIQVEAVDDGLSTHEHDDKEQFVTSQGVDAHPFCPRMP